LDKVLLRLNVIIQEYNEIKNPHGDQLVEWMKNLSAILYYLTTKQVEYHETWNKKMYMGTQAGASVAAQTIICDKEVPELYMLRKIIAAANRNLDVMRSSLSYLKSERDHS